MQDRKLRYCGHDTQYLHLTALSWDICNRHLRHNAAVQFAVVVPVCCKLETMTIRLKLMIDEIIKNQVDQHLQSNFEEMEIRGLSSTTVKIFHLRLPINRLHVWQNWPKTLPRELRHQPCCFGDWTNVCVWSCKAKTKRAKSFIKIPAKARHLVDTVDKSYYVLVMYPKHKPDLED